LIEIYPNKKTEIKTVKKNAIDISKTFLIIDSFETIPKKTPSRVIHIKIIKNEIMKVKTLADGTNKKGINGIKPPKKGEPPFIIDTIILAYLSAFS
jgi:hypothetical protein